MITRDFEQICLEKCDLNKSQPLIVGVSGGADSLCLMHNLFQSGFSVVVAHFDHKLRASSGDDQSFVAAIAAQFGLPFESSSQDVAAYAAGNSQSIEESARTLRYQFLFSIARKYRAQAVAVGHTADDQVETVMMHLLRGAGLSGLKGMEYRTIIPTWDTDLPVVRPLLHWWREETQQYCREHGLETLDDETNQDITFFRNRLRHELIPLLEQYVPKAKNRIWQTADILAGDHALLQKLADQAWHNSFVYQGQGFLKLSRSALLSLEIPLLRRVIHTAAKKLRPDLRDIDYQDLVRAVAFVEQPGKSGRMDWMGNIHLRVQEGFVYFALSGIEIQEPAWLWMASDDRFELSVPGKLKMSDSLELQAKFEAVNSDSSVDQGDPYQAWLDADCLPPRLIVRTRRSGDRFQPLGMDSGSMKISDFFINQKLPQPARDHWPLVFAGDRIAWVPGFRPADWAKVTSKTKVALHLIIRK